MRCSARSRTSLGNASNDDVSSLETPTTQRRRRTNAACGYAVIRRVRVCTHRPRRSETLFITQTTARPRTRIGQQRCARSKSRYVRPHSSSQSHSSSPVARRTLYFVAVPTRLHKLTQYMYAHARELTIVNQPAHMPENIRQHCRQHDYNQNVKWMQRGCWMCEGSAAIPA